jgi:signal peptidase II
MTIGKKSILIILAILTLDQFFKVLIKTNMRIGEEIPVIGNWFILHFTENNGMAFGMDLPGENGKIFLSLFRILAVTGIAFYMRYLIRQKAHNGLVLSVALILAGAAGNIFDSLFYGMIFDDSWGKVATLFPDGGGYSSLLHGRVVDMLYFPVIRGYWPDWFPFWGGQSLVFFRPVFNIADSSITVGVFIILFFQKRFFAELENKEEKEPVPETIGETEGTVEIKETVS